ncbi:MAG: tetratricopeptide repeat protein [Chloroflexi bacterium]|nr:tetratricopeptide repeat protein [Chloroflexota bacterium]
MPEPDSAPRQKQENINDIYRIKGDYAAGDKITGDKVGRDKISVHHYPPPEFPLDNLPPPNPNFTGRLEQLTAIQKAFQSSQAAIAITQTIAGLGGVGKTQLALAYAHDQRDAYDLIWRLHANDPAALDGELRLLGMALGLALPLDDAQAARTKVLSWLNGSDKRWLLIYDNADEITPQDLRPCLPGGQGHVLITSRRPHWSQAQTVRLGVFTAEEAAAFWRKRLEIGRLGIGRTCPEPVEGSGIDGAESPISNRQSPALAELAAELGYLPLALEHAAAYMETRGKSAAAYRRLYRERRRELWARAEPPDDYHATITTTWQIAFDHARQTPGAAALLNLCCFLAPDDIPLGLITEHAAALPPELAAVLADELARDDALAALQTYSLVTRTDGTLNIHRLVQTVARDQMPPETAHTWAEAAVNLLKVAWPFDEHDLATWLASARLLPHLLAAIAVAGQQNLETTDAALLNGKAGFYFLYTASEPAVARPYLERALTIREKALGPDHPSVARDLNNLGTLLQAAGDLAAARPFLERALAILEAAVPNHPNTAAARRNLDRLLAEMANDS